MFSRLTQSVLIASAVAQTASAKTALMLNPGFEREAAGWPVEWSVAWGDPSGCEYATDYAHTGARSLKMTGSVCVESPAYPYAGEVLTVSAWVKLDRFVKSKETKAWYTAAVVVMSLDAKRKPNGHKDVVRLVGTQDWVRYSKDFTFPATTRYVKVQLSYSEKCTGTVWFDDVEILSSADAFKPIPRPFDAAKAAVVVDAAKRVGPVPDLWRHIDSSYMTELVLPGKADVLSRYRQAGFRSVRMHETIYGPRVYREVDGKPVYNWTRFDRSIDLLMENDLKPFVTLESTPNEMAAEQVRSFRNISKVVDLDKWEELIYNIVRHCVERYGRDEVLSWHFELWNEPDAKGYYKGNLQDYLRMYDYTVHGAVRAEPGIRIGGCGGAGNGWVLPLAEHCANGTNAVTGKIGTRIDFLSWHIYCSGGGVPNFSTIERSIRQVNEQLAAFPQFQDTPRIISEWSCNSGLAEWLNTSYRAPFLLRAILKMDELGIERCHNFVTCEYLWNDDVKLFGRGLGFFIPAGVPKAPFHLFTLLDRLAGERVQATSSNAPIDVLASYDQDKRILRVLLGNYAEDPASVFSTTVSLAVSLPEWAGKHVNVAVTRVTPTESNAYDEWEALGKPQVSKKQLLAYRAGKRESEEEKRVWDLIEKLKSCAKLAPPQRSTLSVPANARARIDLSMPVFSVILVEITE